MTTRISLIAAKLLGGCAAAAIAIGTLDIAPAMATSLGSTSVAADTGASLVHKVQRRRDRDRDRDEARRCSEVISATGKQRPTENMAKSSARLAWQEKTRFRDGEQYIDINNARGVDYRCSVSSPTLRLKRCELIARPCRAS